MRDSGLDVSYALRQAAIDEKRDSFVRATDNGFTVGTYQDLIPHSGSGLQPDPGQTALQLLLKRSCR